MFLTYDNNFAFICVLPSKPLNHKPPHNHVTQCTYVRSVLLHMYRRASLLHSVVLNKFGSSTKNVHKDLDYFDQTIVWVVRSLVNLNLQM